MVREENPLVLIVDDDADVLGLLQIVLSSLEVRLETVFTGEEALEILREREASLLILDKNLPGIDGLETGRRARRLRPDVALAMVTGYPSDRAREDAREIGFDEYLRKPIDVADFRRRMRDLLPRSSSPPEDTGAEAAR